MLKFGTVLVGLCICSSAHAEWTLKSSRMWSTGSNTLCAAGVAGTAAVPGRPGTGWLETRFMGPGTGFFQGLGGDTEGFDVTRRCPTSVNETTMNHQHGISSLRVAKLGDFALMAWAHQGGYYHRKSIVLALDPSSATLPASGVTWSQGTTTLPNGPVNNRRPYSLVSLVRNSRNYVDPDPGSFQYPGVTCASPPSSANINDTNFAGNIGADHEGTTCAPPAAIEAQNPGLSVRESGGSTFVSWTERYVENEKLNPGGTPTRGFDAANPVGGYTPWRCTVTYSAGVTTDSCGSGYRCAAGFCSPSWYPYRPLKVHVEEVNSASLLGTAANPGHSNIAGDGTRILTTPRTAGAGLNVSSTASAIEARVTQVYNATSAVWQPVAVWGEAAHAFRPEANQYMARDPVYAPSGPITVYAKLGTSGTTWTSMSGGATYDTLGTACNVQEISSGQASGNKRTFGGILDVVTFGGQPHVIMTQLVGSQCQLSVRRFNGSVWEQVGTDLRVSATSTPAWPRLTVSQPGTATEALYAVWVERDAGDDKVWASRLLSGAWTLVQGMQWNDPTLLTHPRAVGPSIAVDVVPVATAFGPSTTNVYVQVAEETPGHIWVSNVRRCSTLFGSTDLCGTLPGTFLNPKRPRQAGDIYAAPLGDSIGTVAAQKTTSLTAAGVSVHSGWLSIPDSAVFWPFMPGATDLTLLAPGTAGNGNLAMTFIGPSQTHRNHDQGGYLVIDEPLPSFSLGWGGSARVARAAGLSHLLYPICQGRWRCLEFAVIGSNAFGQLGNGQPGKSSTNFQRITLAESVSAYAVGANHNMMVSDKGNLWGWGANASGQLGNGSTESPSTPQLLDSKNLWTTIAAGTDFTVGVRKDGSVWAAGAGELGQLGDSNFKTSATFVQVLDDKGYALKGMVDAYAGADFACARDVKAALWCWGNNKNGQLGRGSEFGGSAYGTARKINASLVAMEVAVGAAHVLVKDQSDKIWSWGSNAYGALGVGDTKDRNQPTLVALPVSGKNVTISASAMNSYITTPDSQVLSAGDDSYGQIGIGEGAKSQTTFAKTSVAKADQLATGPNARFAYLLGYQDAERTKAQFSCFGESKDGVCGVEGKMFYTPTPAEDPFKAK